MQDTSHEARDEAAMLTFPALQDRVVVLAAGLVMVLGLVYIVNRLRKRGEAKRSGGENHVGKGS